MNEVRINGIVLLLKWQWNTWKTIINVFIQSFDILEWDSLNWRSHNSFVYAIHVKIAKDLESIPKKS